MAKAQGTTKGRAKVVKIGSPLTIQLRKMGCTFCATCHAFMWPDHTEHIASMAADRHESRYKVVGGYGNVRLVDMTADAEDMAVAA
jgi:hypothetical protein